MNIVEQKTCRGRLFDAFNSMKISVREISQLSQRASALKILSHSNSFSRFSIHRDISDVHLSISKNIELYLYTHTYILFRNIHTIFREIFQENELFKCRSKCV